MTRIRITKEFKFEMAHALYGYDGACKNIHGHSYRLLVTLIGPVKNDIYQSDNGMVIDFSHLKKIVQKNVIDPFDHSLMLNGQSPHSELIKDKDLSERILLVDFQPTSENMIVDIVNRIRPHLPEGINIHHIKLWETASSYAEWFAEDNDNH